MSDSQTFRLRLYYILKLKKYLHINNKYINFELMELKEYIKTNFGTYQNLADVLQLHKGTVANAISKDTDVSWLNLLKYLSNESRLDKTT